jgi:hypothetical protein
LLWHFNRQRLDFESARDSLLFMSGELDANTGGKAVELFKKPFALKRPTLKSPTFPKPLRTA